MREDERLPYLLWDWLGLRKSPRQGVARRIRLHVRSGDALQMQFRRRGGCEPSASRRAGRNTPLAPIVRALFRRYETNAAHAPIMNSASASSTLASPASSSACRIPFSSLAYPYKDVNPFFMAAWIELFCSSLASALERSAEGSSVRLTDFTAWMLSRTLSVKLPAVRWKAAFLRWARAQ